MGVLYYVQRKNDEMEELFALNKVYTYADIIGVLGSEGEFKPLPARDDFVAMFDDRAWGLRVYERLSAWLRGQRMRVISENDMFELVHVGLTYDQHRAKITGSAHDEDYDVGGVYIPGSAW